MTSDDRKPTRSLISCPRCGLEMRLFGIEQDNPKRDLFSFECEKCGVIEVRGVRVDA